MVPGVLVAGRYRLLAMLGRGGMGTVYDAEHVATGHRIALKVIQWQGMDPEMVRRFEREARATAGLVSQHIVQVFDTGVDEALQCTYLAMERLEGEDLSRLLKRIDGPLPVPVVLRIAAQACTALARAHAAGIVHRDIKPANLFLTGTDTGEIIVKLLDFGIAKVKMESLHSQDDAFTRTGKMLGSPHYMSPEQAQGLRTIDHRSDLWSLGIVLFKCLTGRTPFQNLEGLGQLIMTICSRPAPDVREIAPWVPPEVAAVVQRALAIPVDARFQTAEEMLGAVLPLIAAGGAGAAIVDRSSLRAITAGDLQNIAMPAPQPYVVVPVATPSVSTLTAGGTSMPITDTASPPRKDRRSEWVALGCVLAIAGLLVAGVRIVDRHRRDAAAVAPGAATTGGAAAGRQPALPSPDTTTVTLLVFPDDVTVEVDGVAAAVKSGRVDISGPLGSLHHVRVTRGADQRQEEVAITARGAIPDRVSMAPSPPDHAVAAAQPAAGHARPSAEALKEASEAVSRAAAEAAATKRGDRNGAKSREPEHEHTRGSSLEPQMPIDPGLTAPNFDIGAPPE